MQKSIGRLLIALSVLLPLAAVAGPPVEGHRHYASIGSQHQIDIASAADEYVYYNTESGKYHCLTCKWARRCTVNCIKITRSAAIKRGGVACKVCGGSC